ncbi:hypothetical protein H2200_002029 [Cladophialophora chaetospira]|uniref:Uncharacterized protein n=1 Tax=Cladophialophora chaetospira TaxID=386627 RepID=A0AA38XIT3_9EURO|nr:hypothetical protein H2200_002029 [Cladophialophora chaetospira]
MSVIESQTYRRYSLSLNDLDHILSKQPSTRPHSPHPSSSDLSFDSSWIPAQPLVPVQPPPVRVKTPPGLPSFGSKQATQLRLQQQSSSRTGSRIRSWLSSHDESDERTAVIGSTGAMTSTQTSPITSPPSLHPSVPNGTTDSRELLRRTLAAIGMSRMLDPDPVDRTSSSPLQNVAEVQASSSNSKLNLPPWVYMSNISGPLARADDGTYMRGSFGPRSSGHGIGARGVNSLPLARVAKRAAAPAPTPATLESLRRTDATTGQRSVAAIGPAEEVRPESEEKRRTCAFEEPSMLYPDF